MSIDRFLGRIKIVLVEPSHPGNIGATARAMKTMGIYNLAIVNPKKYPHYEASKRAAGGSDVLDSAALFDSLRAAVSDCTMVFGTSVRDREIEWPTYDARQAAKQIGQHLAKFDGIDQSIAGVAIVFGRESSGLSNAEMALCDRQVRIDANPEYSSLNLGSAVQLLCYELRMQALVDNNLNSIEGGEPSQDSNATTKELSAAEKRRLPASIDLRNGHLEHLQSVLEALDFVKADSPTILFRKLARLYAKADLTVEEIQILRGVLSAIEQHTKHS